MVDQALFRFSRNPSDTRLSNHALSGKLYGFWSFSVTDDLRIVYRWKGKNLVQLLVVGIHQKVYGDKMV